MLLSVIVPVYNEQEVLSKFHNLLLPEVKKASNDSYEIIYVNDGSKDTTLNLLMKLLQKIRTSKSLISRVILEKR